jgi:hypothetical protein
MAGKQEPNINSERDRFRDSVIIVISLIFPLIITAIGLFASYSISTNSEINAIQNCIHTLQVGVANYTQYNGCIHSEVLLYDSEQYAPLANYLNRSFIILFVIVILFLAYLLFSKEYVKYITELVIPFVIIWGLVFLMGIAVIYSAIPTNLSSITGIPIVITEYVFKVTNSIIAPNNATNIIAPNNATNNIFAPDFVQWDFYLFIIIFLELIVHSIWDFKNKRKKQ